MAMKTKALIKVLKKEIEQENCSDHRKAVLKTTVSHIEELTAKNNGADIGFYEKIKLISRVIEIFGFVKDL